MKTYVFSVLLFAVVLFGETVRGDMIIDMVAVGNVRNTADTAVMINDGTTGYGAVSYEYRIGKYEVTNAQWRGFLTAKASFGDPYELYNTNMGGKYGGISRSGSGTSGDPYVYGAKGGDANWDNRPVNWVNFWDAARFSNWLHNGQGNGDTETGAYENIGNKLTFARQEGAKYFIPTENEWYKAAYYDPNKTGSDLYWDWPTQSDSPPENSVLTPDHPNNANYYNFFDVDGPRYTEGLDPPGTTPVGLFSRSGSAYGTFDQGGNVWEWNELPYSGSEGLFRGGSWNDLAWWGNYQWTLSSSFRYYGLDPGFENYSIGFRVAGSEVPEPTSLVALASLSLTGIGIAAWKRRRKPQPAAA